ncbi:unnamed protein product [Absidia cylindrospora]
MVEQELTNSKSQQNLLSGSREAMEPLYEQLLSQSFSDSHSAVEFCRHACAEFGFTVKQEASANKNIYVYCSREGLPDSLRKPKPVPQRKRPSKRCDCRWRVVLSETSQGRWEFRKSTSVTAYEHNHEMMNPKEMVKAWPAQVNDYIIQLARQQQQHLQTHDIRELVKRRFPDITWNERRFYNRLTEERKRIKQREVIERVRRLLLLSAQLCSVVAATSSDEWFGHVEADLTRLFDHYAQLARLPPDAVSSLVDLHLDHISMDTPDYHPAVPRKSASFSNDTTSHPLCDSSSSSAKMVKWENPVTEGASRKRKCTFDPPSLPPKGTHMVHVPPFKLYVRPHHTRSLSSQQHQQHQQQQQQLQQPPPLQLHHRLSFSDALSSPSTMIESSSDSPHPQSISFNQRPFYSLESPSSSSVSSSASTFQQQHVNAVPSSSDQLQYQPSAAGSTATATSTSSFYLSGSSYQSSQPFADDTSNRNSSNNSTGGMSLHPTYSSFHPHYDSSQSNDLTFLDHSSLLPQPLSSQSPPPPSSSPPPSSVSSSSTQSSSTPSRQHLPLGILQQGYRPVMDTTTTTNPPHDASMAPTPNHHPLFVYSATRASPSTTTNTPTPSKSTKDGFFDTRPPSLQPQSHPSFAMGSFSAPQKHHHAQHDDASSMENMVLENPSLS